MNDEWCIYIALYCVLLYTQSALQSYRGSLLNHHQCAASTWMMRRQPQDNGASALTTHQLQVERREIHRANQVDGDYWEAMIDKGQWREFGQDTGVTPLLFTTSAMGFLMTTESQDLGLTSHLKDGFIYVTLPSMSLQLHYHQCWVIDLASSQLWCLEDFSYLWAQSQQHSPAPSIRCTSLLGLWQVGKTL